MSARPINNSLILLRMAVVLAFVGVTPLLAIPGVCRWLDRRLYGEPPPLPQAPLPQTRLPTSPGAAPGAIAPRAARPLIPPPTPVSRRFPAIQRRLQQLGATYILLESVGQQTPQFRFHCRLRGRSFEQTADRPLEAMERVLAEAETWVAARAANESSRRR